jgi:cell fate regulator YaaT (PSP1 superfamily)
MTRVIGVRFRTAGKIYFFDPLEFEIKRGDHVIVETARGIEFGTVVSDIREVEDDKVVQPLKPVIRIATQRDVEQEQANRQKEKDAFQICLAKIRKHNLEMKLIDAEYTFDNNKVLFYFTADGRIDFRELVKDLAGVFKTRIELRQIGVRDETKIIGGIGICGRPLCCHSYLSDFIPVSIKMAKEQNLSLNPTKISGVCGRLMCCLKNEEETYEELNRRLPSVGDMVTAEDGCKGEVQSVNVLRQLVKVIVEDGDSKEIREYEVGQLHFKRKHSKKERMELSPEEQQELERLEQVELEESKSEEQTGGRQDNRSDNRSEGRRQDNYRQNGGNGESRRERAQRDGGEERRGNRGERRQNNNNRPEQRSEKAQENRSGNRQDSRQENRQDNRQDNRSGERRYRKDRRNRTGRKPEQNENEGNSSEPR